jgi:hypothetical protein
VPYFAGRKLSPGFTRLQAEGAFRRKPGDRDIAELISKDREDRALAARNGRFLTPKPQSGSIWQWKHPLRASGSGPTPRTAESNFLSGEPEWRSSKDFAFTISFGFLTNSEQTASASAPRGGCIPFRSFKLLDSFKRQTQSHGFDIQ